jgi:hypothetical protein
MIGHRNFRRFTMSLPSLRADRSKRHFDERPSVPYCPQRKPPIVQA